MSSILVALLLALPLVSADIIINEVMAKPQDESLNEWVEFYNNGDNAVDVAGWKFGDANDNDTIVGGKYGNTGTIINGHGYAILTDDNTRAYDNFNVSSDAIHLYVDDTSLGNGLINSGETLYLYDAAGALVQQVSYGSTATDTAWALIDGGFQQQAATAGYSNTGSTGSGPVQAASCDWSLEIILNKTVFTTEEFSWKMRATKVAGDATQLSSTATIEDAEGNVTKSYTPWNSEDATSQKTSSSYSPNLQPGVYLLNANLSAACTESDMSNNKAAKIFTIKGAAAESPESSITIDAAVSEKSYKFGDTVMPKVTIYRGDTQKYAVTASITKDGRKAGEEMTLHAPDKFTTVTLTMPIKLYDNCERSLVAGAYELRLEGLDTQAAAPITIENNCSKKGAETRHIESSTMLIISDVPSSLAEGSMFNVSALLFHTGASRNVSLWSYIQKGSKVYGKQEVKAEIAEKPMSFVLNQSLAGIEAGEYKLTIAFLDAERREIDLPFSVAKKLEQEKQEKAVEAVQASPAPAEMQEVSGAAVSEVREKEKPAMREYNANAGTKDIIQYGLILALGALSIYLLFRRKS